MRATTFETTDFESFLFGRRLSDMTVIEYGRAVKRVSRIVGEQGWNLESLTNDQTRWLAHQIPPSTRKNVRSALIHYWRMVGYDGPVDAILVDTDPTIGLYKGLSEDDTIRIEAVARQRDDGLPILIGLYLGLRRSEIAQLRWDAFSDGWVTVNGKGRRKRTLPVHPKLARELPGGYGWVFPGPWGKTPHVHDSTIYGRISRVAEAAGIGRIKPHALRHTCLTRLYRATGDLRLVQLFAGHSSSVQTETYTHVFADELADGVLKLDYGAA